MDPKVVAVLALAASCSPPEPPAETPAPSWVYPPPQPAWQFGESIGRFGRSQPPQAPLAGGITGEVRVPLLRARPWSVPNATPPRAIVFGFEGVRPAVELIDVDRGRVVWRDATCSAPVVGVVAAAVVCGDPAGTRALGLDGKARWTTGRAFVAMTDDRVVVSGAGDGEVVVLGADDGVERGTAKLPPTVVAASIVASCSAREWFAFAADHKLVRIADVKDKLAITWAIAVDAVAELDPCAGESIVVATGDALLAIERATGKVTGRVDGVRGHWRARDDSDQLEVATGAGVERWPRSLIGPPVSQALPPLGALLDARGDRRLVRASPRTVVLLDRAGVHSYFAFAATHAALGESSVIGASSIPAPLAGRGPVESSDAVRRVVIPARTRRAVRVPARRPGVAMPAELRDLPATTPLDAGAAIAKPDTAMHSVAAVALDPSEPDALFAVALEREPDATATNAIARVDLATRSWRWQRSDGCGPGTPVELALAADVVACAARGTMSTVRATSRGGSARWQWETDHIDRLQGAGAVVLAYDADRLTVLDAATGRPQGRFASDDGAAVRAAAVVVDATTWLVTFERGRIVARVTSVGMIATWSMRVDGVVRDLAASGDGVLVDLEDGDAYRIDLRTLQVTALPGLGLDWRAAGELITGHIAGGPIPGVEAAHVRVATPPRLAFDRFGRSLTPDRSPEAPVLWVPISPPPPLGESWQYALFERTGGLRARNDYALAPPIAPTTVRGPSGSPLVVTYGPQMREALVLDPRTGDPLRRIALPETGLVFGTIVDGTPVAGVVLGAPLRVVVF